MTKEKKEERNYYRKVLHSKLLCSDRDCDICHRKSSCGFIEVSYPVDTTGNNKIWKCFCGTTACILTTPPTGNK